MGIKVNAIHPGYVRTDMNAGAGAIDVREGARSSVQMALLDADGPTGTFNPPGRDATLVGRERVPARRDTRTGSIQASSA